MAIKMTDGWGSDNGGENKGAANAATEREAPEETVERLPNGQFSPKKSGNPRGRPRKRERSFTQRQLRRDILEEFERELTINGEKLPAIRFVLRRVIHEAANGNKTAMKMAIDIHRLAVTENEETNPKATGLLEVVEQAPEVDERDPQVSKILNEMRVKTRKL